MKKYTKNQQYLRDIVTRLNEGRPVFMGEIHYMQSRDRRTLTRANIAAGTGDDRGQYMIID